jgi:hypothetical protein
VQANANKGKEMKGCFLSFIFIFFSESRLFNGLRSKKIKKYLPRPTRGAGCGPKVQTARAAHLRVHLPASGREILSAGIHSAYFWFYQENVIDSLHIGLPFPDRQ